MSEEAAHKNPKRSRPTFIMVPRKLVIAWCVSTAILFILSIGSFQYANYVDRRSNHYWCGIVALFNNTYHDSPPKSDPGKTLAREFLRLRDGFNCT